MNLIPAICDTCHAIFPSGFAVGGGLQHSLVAVRVRARGAEVSGQSLTVCTDRSGTR